MASPWGWLQKVPVGQLKVVPPASDISTAIVNNITSVCTAVETSTQTDICPVVATNCPNLTITCENLATQRFSCDMMQMLAAALSAVSTEDQSALALTLKLPSNAGTTDIQNRMATTITEQCATQANAVQIINGNIQCTNSKGLDAMFMSKLDQGSACTLGAATALIQAARGSTVASANRRAKTTFWAIAGVCIVVFVAILLAIILGIRK